MNRQLIITLFFLSCFFCVAQVGVNSHLPLHPLHIDGKENNLSGGSDLNNDDVVVTKDGNLGIGVLNPTVKLEVKGGLKITGTTDAAGKAVTSNSDGVVGVKELPEILPSVIGVFEKGSAKSGGSSTAVFTNATITLKRGKWIVNWGLTLTVSNSSLWLTSYLSTSINSREETGFRFISTGTNKPAIGANLVSGYAFLSGSSLIEVLDEEVTINVLINNTRTWAFASSSWENYLYALPFK